MQRAAASQGEAEAEAEEEAAGPAMLTAVDGSEPLPEQSRSVLLRLPTKARTWLNLHLGIDTSSCHGYTSDGCVWADGARAMEQLGDASPLLLAPHSSLVVRARLSVAHGVARELRHQQANTRHLRSSAARALQAFSSMQHTRFARLQTDAEDRAATRTAMQGLRPPSNDVSIIMHLAQQQRSMAVLLTNDRMQAVMAEALGVATARPCHHLVRRLAAAPVRSQLAEDRARALVQSVVGTALACACASRRPRAAAPADPGDRDEDRQPHMPRQPPHGGLLSLLGLRRPVPVAAPWHGLLRDIQYMVAAAEPAPDAAARVRRMALAFTADPSAEPSRKKVCTSGVAQLQPTDSQPQGGTEADPPEAAVPGTTAVADGACRVAQQAAESAPPVPDAAPSNWGKEEADESQRDPAVAAAVAASSRPSSPKGTAAAGEAGCGAELARLGEQLQGAAGSPSSRPSQAGPSGSPSASKPALSRQKGAMGKGKEN